MLILGRRPGETVVIDGGIRIVVVSCDRRGVRLGFEAPPSVGIARGEIAEQAPDGSLSVRRNGHAISDAGAAAGEAKESSQQLPAAPPGSSVPALPAPPVRPTAGSRSRRDE